jgi:hypothetical protein
MPTQDDTQYQHAFSAKKFVFSRKLPGGREAEVARVEREGRFASTAAFVSAALTDAHRYYLTIQPGYDVAFVVALALVRRGGLVERVGGVGCVYTSAPLLRPFQSQSTFFDTELGPLFTPPLHTPSTAPVPRRAVPRQLEPT